jgi:hypothetical protein
MTPRERKVFETAQLLSELHKLSAVYIWDFRSPIKKMGDVLVRRLEEECAALMEENERAAANK